MPEENAATSKPIQFKPDRLYCLPLGGQSEVGQAMWVFYYGGRILLVDAGAAYPPQDLPGVDLVFPNLSFLESRQDAIEALLLTNGHEEHSGGMSYVLQHLNVPVIMAPEFVLSLFQQNYGKAQLQPGTKFDKSQSDTKYETVSTEQTYQVGPFTVEWVRVNDAIADACALYVSTPTAKVFYTSSFKLDQTPVDGQLLDLSRIAQIGENRLDVLISDSAGVEKSGYAPSERSVLAALTEELTAAPSRVFIVLPGTNTHRLQLIFDIALKLGRKVILYGETLLQTAVAAVATGNLKYERRIEADLKQLDLLPDNKVLIVATGSYGDPLQLLSELADDRNPHLKVKTGDSIIYSAGISLGHSRAMAVLLDAFLARGVHVRHGAAHNIHVSKHAGQEELKLMLTMTQPKIFLPALGERRHIAHHAQIAIDWGIDPQAVFCLRNGDVFEVAGVGVAGARSSAGSGADASASVAVAASIISSVETAPVFYNRDQEEKVTMHSVKERKYLSYEGVITIGCVLNLEGGLAGEPSIEGGGSGFLQSLDWLALKTKLKEKAAEVVAEFATKPYNDDLLKLKDGIREQANKLIRGQLLVRPLVQVMIQRL